jgi:glycine cleavage system transcriptional repressor
MKIYNILLSVGNDRPGIVNEVSTLLFEHGANIEDSRMAAMGGCFSIMTLFSCTPEQLEDIRAGLEALRKAGLDCSLHEARDPGGEPREAALPLRMEVLAMDHPGIVQRVVRILHRHRVNIESLDTRLQRAPLSGAPLFDLTLEAAVPGDTSIQGIKEELLDLAAELNLDLTFGK